MAQPDRLRLRMSIALYVALALAWLGIARWIIPPLLLAENPGPTLAALKRYIGNVAAPFLTSGTMNRWREFAAAVLIAMVLHLTILLFLRRYNIRDGERDSTTDPAKSRRLDRWLLAVSFAFLTVTILTGARQDYYLYLQMWYEVRQGHDPWFIVFGIDGRVPLNAYGPLFNLLAGLAWVNALAPKLLFAHAYLLFAVWQIKEFTARRPASPLATCLLLALFWNPFPWVEIAIRGHFDILVGLSCLCAIRARTRGLDVLSGVCLALGVLLKFFPVVLVPFLAYDRGRLRPRFLVASVSSIALGMAISCNVWGLSTLSPLTFVATRRSTTLSIFRFLRGQYSPIRWLGGPTNLDGLSPLVLSVALLRAWSWFRIRQPDLETASVIAVTTTVLFYRTGFPQYQMVPFVLGAYWAVRNWDRLGGRIACVIGVAGYFGFLAAFDVYYAFVDETSMAYYWLFVQQTIGLPAFFVGCAFLASVVRSAAPADRRQSSSSSDVSSRSSC